MSSSDPTVDVSRCRRRSSRTGSAATGPPFTLLGLGYLAYLGPLRWLARLLPARLFLRLARPLVSAYGRVRRAQVAACEGAMARSLSWRDADELRRCAVAYVEGFARRALDDLAMTRRAMPFEDVEVEGEEVWRAALSEGKGLLLFSGHFYASRAARVFLERHCDLRIQVVRIGLPPPHAVGRWGRRFLQPAYDRFLSRSYGNEILLRDRRSAPLQILRVLRANGVIYSNLDSVYSRDIWRVAFLNDTRIFPGGLLDLARVTGAPLVPVELLGHARRLRIRFLPRVELEAAPDRDAFVVRNLPKLVAQLEQTVRENPAEWEGWGDFGRRAVAAEPDLPKGKT